MYQLNDYIMYKREVCKIAKIKEKYYKDDDYYELRPVSDSSLKIDVPIKSELLSKVMTKEEVEDLVSKIPHIPLIESKSRLIENEYKVLLATRNHEDLVKVIKTTYLRNKKRKDNHKRTGDKDTYYLALAESYLYGELSVALDKSIEEIREFITSKFVEE